MELRAVCCSFATQLGLLIHLLREEEFMAYPGKRDGLAKKVETAAQEAERLGLTTATLILRMARLEIDRAEHKEAEEIANRKLRTKPN
jgi:hypothetical protein